MSGHDSSALNDARPFPGLRAFAFDDHEYFFGREDQVFALYRMLERSRFMAVVGSSGSGKSSLVRAGLLPLLEEERKGAEGPGGRGRKWRWTELRPGDAPLSRLADALIELAGEDRDDPNAGAIRSARRDRLESSLWRSSFGLTEALRSIAGDESPPFFILVDQFEELFRYASLHSEDSGHAAEARRRDEAAQFVQLLLEASRDRDHGAYIMITMRSDFIGDCSRFYGLPEAVSASQYLVPSLARHQQEEAIRGPAAKAGAAMDSILVERILNDAGNDLDQLPVLQHCLSRVWAHARQARPGDAPTLVLGDYEAVGGIAEALSRHADEVMASLPGLERVVEQVFRALAELDDEGRATRRAMSFARLLAESGAPKDDLRRVLDRFRADDCSFLVPSLAVRPLLADDTTIDVGHEALLRRWERISRKPTGLAGTAERGGWLANELEDARVYRALLALLDPDDPHHVTILPLDEVDRLWPGWNERPRTAAWAERYGGQIDRVRKLFDDSRAAHKRNTRNRHIIRGFIAALVLFIIVYVVVSNIQTKNKERQASFERSLILTEMTTMATEISGGLRFTPLTNKAIRDMLLKAQAFLVDYKEKVRRFDKNAAEDTSVIRLDVTAKILDSDYLVNFGHLGAAIERLGNTEDGAMQELKRVSSKLLNPPRSLRIAEADVLTHRARAETLYDSPNAARDDLAEAEQKLNSVLDDQSDTRPGVLRKIVDDVSSALDRWLGMAGTAEDQEDRSEERMEQAREKLAEVYAAELDLELHHDGSDAATARSAAATYFDKYQKLVADRLNSFAGDAHDAATGDACDAHDAATGGAKDPSERFWKDQKNSLLQQTAGLRAAQQNFDEAISLYDCAIGMLKKSAAAGDFMGQLRKAFAEYLQAQVLSQRAQGSDVEQARADLDKARKNLDDGVAVYTKLKHDDPDNTWWWLVDAWVERALGDVLRQAGKTDEAKAAYTAAWQDDRHLQDKDNLAWQDDEHPQEKEAANPRIAHDLDTDRRNLESVGD